MALNSTAVTAFKNAFILAIEAAGVISPTDPTWVTSKTAPNGAFHKAMNSMITSLFDEIIAALEIKGVASNVTGVNSDVTGVIGSLTGLKVSGQTVASGNMIDDGGGAHHHDVIVPDLNQKTDPMDVNQKGGNVGVGVQNNTGVGIQNNDGTGRVA